jgi:acetyl esterase/lipase
MDHRFFSGIFQALLGLLIIYSTQSTAQENTRTVPLWKNGAPGFEKLKAEKELAQDWWVRNINDPSLTIFLPPKEKANGTAVLICPGGGFRNLVFNSEGRDAARYLNSLGITALVLKYRLFRMENTPYNQEHPTQDIFRAMRVAKNMAQELSIDTTKLGVMGFSAGGEVAAWVSYRFMENHVASHDAIDKINPKPSFQILIYPGPLCVPEVVPSNAPPTFLVTSNNDECCSQPTLKLVELHRASKVPVELHLYEKGAHAFNMGSRSEFISLKNWPQRLADWMIDNHWIE